MERRRLANGRGMGVLTPLVALAIGGWMAAVALCPPETVVLDELVNLYGPVEFPHGMHVEVAEGCTSCHHHGGDGTSPRACKECHRPASTYRYLGARRRTGLGLKGAYHAQCLGCHRESEAGPQGCVECHVRRARSSSRGDR